MHVKDQINRNCQGLTFRAIGCAENNESLWQNGQKEGKYLKIRGLYFLEF